MNNFICTGNLTRDPVLKQTKEKKSVCNFTLAVNRQYKGADGKRPTDYFDFVVWDKRAETIVGLLKRGMRIHASGELQAYSYTGNNGTKYEKHRVSLGEFEILSARKREDEPMDYHGEDCPFPIDIQEVDGGEV